MHIPKTSTAAKIAAIALAGTMAVTLAACGSSKPAENSNNENNANNQVTQSSNANATENANAENTANAETNANENTPVSTALENTFNAPGYLNRIPSPEDPQAPRVADFAINGMALAGNQHDNTETYAGTYKTEGIQSEFNLNEWIYIYMDDASNPLLGTDTSIIALPHQDIETYKMALKSDLLTMAEASGGFVVDVMPENLVQDQGLNLIGSGYVNMDIGQPGSYDIVICKGDLPAYYIMVNMLPVANAEAAAE